MCHHCDDGALKNLRCTEKGGALLGASLNQIPVPQLTPPVTSGELVNRSESQVLKIKVCEVQESPGTSHCIISVKYLLEVSNKFILDIIFSHKKFCLVALNDTHSFEYNVYGVILQVKM